MVVLLVLRLVSRVGANAARPSYLTGATAANLDIQIYTLWTLLFLFLSHTDTQTGSVATTDATYSCLSKSCTYCARVELTRIEEESAEEEEEEEEEEERGPGVER